MNYKFMWEQMKEHYEKRAKKTEGKEYESSINPHTISKSVLNVMEHFELKEGYKKS